MEFAGFDILLISACLTLEALVDQCDYARAFMFPFAQHPNRRRCTRRVVALELPVL